MKASEIRDLSADELGKKIRDVSEELLQLRLRKQTGQVETPHQLHTLRKDIARMKTILAQKQKAA
jgi:large subunit ribosomal protein L29